MYKALRLYLEDWKRRYLQGTRPVNLVGDFYKLLFRLGAQKINADSPAGSARFGAFARFSAVLADFEHTHRRGRYVDDNGTRRWRGGRDRGREYLQALHRYLLYYAHDAYEEFEGELLADTDAVDILTVHQAKGLEWPVVFIPALTDQRFPSGKAGRSQSWLLEKNVFPKAKRQPGPRWGPGSAQGPLHRVPPRTIGARPAQKMTTIEKLDQYVDAAYTAGLPFARIIHGKGT